jgi:hypothetical protein
VGGRLNAKNEDVALLVEIAIFFHFFVFVFVVAFVVVDGMVVQAPKVLHYRDFVKEPQHVAESAECVQNRE